MWPTTTAVGSRRIETRSGPRTAATGSGKRHDPDYQERRRAQGLRYRQRKRGRLSDTPLKPNDG
jgi:hypothetical protein